MRAMIASFDAPFTAKMNGKPKRSRYRALRSLNRANSGGVSRSRPTPACSCRDSSAMAPATAARSARSGCACSSASCAPHGVARTAPVNAATSASRLANGRAAKAAWATHGDRSATSPKRPANASASRAFTASIGRGFINGSIGVLPAPATGRNAGAGDDERGGHCTLPAEISSGRRAQGSAANPCREHERQERGIGDDQ